MSKRIGLTGKLLVPGIAGTLAFGLVLTFVQIQVYRYAHRSKAAATRDLVESAASTVAKFGNEERKGTMTRQAAQAAALAVLREMRYGASGYFWINDLEPRMIMHPTNSALNGKDLSDYKDPNGVRLFVEMAKICRASGSGFVNYEWAKPGASKPVPKVSYVTLYPDWNWVIGSGVYIDDVDAEVWALARTAFGSMLAIAAVFGIGTLVIARAAVNPLKWSTKKLSDASEQILGAAAQVMNTSKGIADGASEQAKHVREITTSVRSLAEAVSAVSADAVTTDSLMGQVGKALESGRRQISKMSDAMREIAGSNRQVSSISREIDEIAFQTNLLALNAAVEAARAGEAGVGFAVVAEEVRNLAQRVSEAAKNSNSEIEQTLAKTREGSSIAGEMMSTFAELSAKIDAVTGRAAQIVETAARGNSRVTELQGAFERLGSITDSNAAVAEETAAISEELQNHAATLDQVVHPLVSIVEGDHDGRQA